MILGETIIGTVQAPWIPAKHRVELVMTADHPRERELVTAAFGLIFDVHDRLLLTHVNLPGRGWDVPGGHIDSGEHPVEAAAREVEEETGYVVPPDILKLIGWQRFTLLEAPPDWYPYPFPLSYTLMFAAQTGQGGQPVEPPAGSECGPAEWCTMAQVADRCARTSWWPFVGAAPSCLRNE